MFTIVDNFWKRKTEAFKAPLLGAILSVIGYGSYRIHGYLSRAENENELPQYALEVDVQALLQTMIFTDAMMLLVYTMGIFVNFYALYFTAKNIGLIKSIRVVATGENLNRLLLNIIQFLGSLCGLLARYGPASITEWCPTDGIFGFILNNGNNLQILAIYCQGIISFSRFMAISFNGMYFSYTMYYPFGQLLLAYFLGILNLLLSYVRLDFGWCARTVAVCFITSFDYFTYKALQRKKIRVTKAERQLMFQTIFSSIIVMNDYVVTNFIAILLDLFCGIILWSLVLIVLSSMQMALYTLGQGVINAIFLKKPKERRVSAVSTTTRLFHLSYAM